MARLISLKLYFAFRLWKLSKRLPLPLFSFALCLVAQCLSLVITVKAFAMTSVSAFAVDQDTIIVVSLASRVVYDLTTAMGLAWYLRKQRPATFARHAILLPNSSHYNYFAGQPPSLTVWFCGLSVSTTDLAEMAHVDPVTLQKLA
jgi:hypothetical protein